jgi:hypothetical protein
MLNIWIGLEGTCVASSGCSEPNEGKGTGGAGLTFAGLLFSGVGQQGG